MTKFYHVCRHRLLDTIYVHLISSISLNLLLALCRSWVLHIQSFSNKYLHRLLVTCHYPHVPLPYSLSWLNIAAPCCFLYKPCLPGRSGCNQLSLTVFAFFCYSLFDFLVSRQTHPNYINMDLTSMKLSAGRGGVVPSYRSLQAFSSE